MQDKVFDDQGQPVIDPITRRQVTKDRIDPVTNQPVPGETYYLDSRVSGTADQQPPV